MKIVLRLFVLIFILTISLITLTAHNACADGMVIPTYYQDVYLPSQKAAIFWNESQEIMILSTKFATHNLTDMVWIVPIISDINPEIEKGEIEIFYDLAKLFHQGIKLKSQSEGLGIDSSEPEVQVIKIKKIDIFDITILRATNASKLVQWLYENNYTTKGISISVLQSYCDQSNSYFIANKVNLTNEYSNLSITQKDQECADNIYIPDWIQPEDIDFYIQQELDLFGYSDVSFEAVKILVELKRGISTPIKIIFQPEKPFYPLAISSINRGDTEVNIYFFSKKPMKDENRMLSIQHMVQLSDYDKDTFNLSNKYNYITLLTYKGNLSQLDNDSFFVATQYDPSLHPDYVPLDKQIARFILPKHNYLFIFFFYPLPILPLFFILLPFVGGYLPSKNSSKIKNKEFPFTIMFIIIIILLMIIGFITGFIALYATGWITTLALIWLFITLPVISIIDGYYAAHKDAKKRIWLTVILFLLIYSFILL